MILQALTRQFEILCQQGKLARPGWDTDFKVSFGLKLDETGELLDVLDLRAEEQRGKKAVLIPRRMTVPHHTTRSSGVAANLLCDNVSYLLGVDDKGKPERSKECFAAAAELHHRLLDGVDAPAARAILAYFDRWNPDVAREHPLIAPLWKELAGSANLMLFYGMTPTSEDEAIRAAWQNHYDSSDDDLPRAQCLVTGETAAIPLTHPKIKGVYDAQSSGASLVSFNAPALVSYGHEQNENAPVSKYAAFAYTSALNALLSDREHCRQIGDTTMVCWAEHGEECYQDAIWGGLFGTSEGVSDQDLAAMLKKIARGESCDWNGVTLRPEEHFYILGLSPNAARISVRFFFQDSFGSFVQHIDRHYEDTAIVRPSYDKREHLAVWQLLNETVNQNAKTKSPSPRLVGDVMRAILGGTPYPASLLNGASLRIRAEHKVTRGRAAILKAYYIRHPHPSVPKEVLTMNGDPNSTNIPYTLGRLFSIYEQIQSAALPNLNTTIADRYFNSAAATPALTFSRLGSVARSHLKVLHRDNEKAAIALEKKLIEYSAKIGDHYPTRLTLQEQGAFQLGYYFETQQRFTKKNSDTAKED